MYIIHRPDIDLYKTIYEEDEMNFIQVINSGVFQTENKFELITDKENIRKILNDKFSSKNRTEEYTQGLPSATIISSALFPMNLNQYAEKNDVALLRWFNDKDKEEYDLQQVENKKSTENGTFIHKVLELAILDDVRIFKKLNKLDDYINEALISQDVKREVLEIGDKKDYLNEMAKNVLGPFFESEFRNIDPIFSEIFLKVSKIQGSIDLVFMKDKQLYIGDFKSSKKPKSRKQLIDNGYLRQLYIYSVMMLEAGLITKKEYDNLNFCIYFFNWNSGRYSVQEFSKYEVDKSRLYVDYILDWYYKMKE